MDLPTHGTGPSLADLLDERGRLVELVRALPEEVWRTPPATGGLTIAERVTRLALLDEAAALAITAPDRFANHPRARLAGNPTAGDIAARAGSRPAPSLLRWLGRTERALVRAYRDLDLEHRLPWYGTELRAGAALAARLTDTWAHGWDVARGLGAGWPPTERLRPIADLGIRSLATSFELLGRPVPGVPVRIELTAPDGTLWTWGREDARDVVTGAAEDLCLVLTGRRGLADVPLRVSGAVVGEWLAIGRAYPGIPEPRGAGRKPEGLPASRPSEPQVSRAAAGARVS